MKQDLSVDLAAPAVTYPTVPGSLKVGEPIAEMTPVTSDADNSYNSTSLPAGLDVHPTTGIITGAPTTAGDAVTATVTVTDAAGNTSTVTINFSKVDKGEQTLTGFGYRAAALNFGATAPALKAPEGAAVTLTYTTTSADVCTVNAASGALTIIGVGECVISATAAGNENYEGDTDTFTVTVQPLSALALNLAATAGDDTINLAEKTAGFKISGNTGSVAGVVVEVTIGSETPLTADSAKAPDAKQDDLALWSVDVPGKASYITETSVAVVVTATKLGYTDANLVNRNLSVDLTAPAVSYTAPASLQVGEAIASMSPASLDKDIDSFSTELLPAGLSLDGATGDITGAPTTAGIAVTATVTVTDAAKNSKDVTIKFPKVDKGEQTLTGFGYGAASLNFGATAPAVTEPSGAAAGAMLVYSATPPSVCRVDSASGELTIVGVGACVVTVTAAAGDNHNEGKASFTVTVLGERQLDAWEFHRFARSAAFDPNSVPADEHWSAVTLPHTANLEPRITAGRNKAAELRQWQGDALYRRDLFAETTWRDQAVWLRFEGAMMVAKVYVNGALVFTHLGGYLPFTVDLSRHLKYGQTNQLLVHLDNRDNTTTGPKPLVRLDFNMYGGLYREVTLSVRNKLHVTDEILAKQVAGGGIFVTYPAVTNDEAAVSVKTHVANTHATDARTFKVLHTLRHGDTVAAQFTSADVSLAAGADTHQQASLTVANPRLWSPQSPALHDLHTRVVENGQVVDERNTRIGIRRIEFRNDGFHINGGKMYLRGVNRHQEYPYVGYALSPNADYRDAKLIKEAGFDFVRLSHYPHSRHFMRAADELGLVLLNAILGWQYRNNTVAFANHVYGTCADLVRRDRNHPSVVAWECSLNETTMPNAFIDQLHKRVHDEYPGDQAYSAGWKSYGYDIYLEARQHRLRHVSRAFPDKPYIVSEYGDWEYYSQNAGLNQDAWADLTAAERTSRQLLAHGEVRLLQQAANIQEAHNDNRSIRAVADGYWAMFDYNRGYLSDLEASGIMSLERLPKPSYYFFRSQRDADEVSELFANSGLMVHIANEWRSQSPRAVRVFSNADTVELFLNGKSLGKQTPDSDRISGNLQHAPFTFETTQFEAGTLEAAGCVDSGVTCVSHTVRTPGNSVAEVRAVLATEGIAPVPRDLVFAHARTLDAAGATIPITGRKLRFTVDDSLEIVGGAIVLSENGTAAALVRVLDPAGQMAVSAELLTPEVQAAGTLTEAGLDGATVTLTLPGNNFAAVVRTSQVTVTGLAGVSVASVTRAGSTELRVTLAYDRTDFDVAEALMFRVAAAAITDSQMDLVSDFLPVTPRLQDPPAYLSAMRMETVSHEAESNKNTRSGNTGTRACAACSGGQKLHGVGNSPGNYLIFNVATPVAGTYQVTIHYLAGSDSAVTISVNGGSGTTLNNLNSGSDGRVATVAVSLDLVAGNNTIKLSNDTAWAPHFDKIEMVMPVAGEDLDTFSLDEDSAGSYLVALQAQPADDVTVTLSSSAAGVTVDTEAGTPGNQNTLTFTSANWNVAQVVTVRAARDGGADDRSVTITHAFSGDAGYAAKGDVLLIVTVVNRTTDYDADDDGLIEVRTLEQLNAVRWDLNGDGAADSSSDNTDYAAAFPDPAAAAGFGNGALGCSNVQGAAACTGYELEADLDFDADGSYADPSLKTAWTSGLGWAPIGGDADRFAATFDGNGHSIANLFINRSSERVGLFGHANSSARLRNLGLKNIDVTGGASVGALAGRLEGRVERCHASGTVEGATTGKVGGLVGDNENGSVSASYARVAVTGAGGSIGGLVGRNKGSVVLSFAAGAVKGGRFVGGLVGNQIGHTLKAVYAAGAVTGSADRVGGLAGNNEGAITAGYATGAVNGTSFVGGLVGKNAGGSVAASYWDIQTSSQGSSAQGVGKSTAELQLPASYKGVYANWNLDLDSDGGGDNHWDFGASSQYPALKADLNGDGVATVTEFGGGLGHQTLRRGLAVSEAAVTVEEDGGTADYTVVLVSAPAANVVVAPASGDMAAAAVSPPSLTFTPINWSTAQPVTVTGVNDNIDNIDNAGDVRETEIRYTVSSTDSDYDNIAVPPLAVVVADDDTAALALSVSPTTLAEGGSGAVDVTVSASLSGAAIHGDLVLPLVLGGTARAGADYQVDALPAITIAGGNTVTATLSITPLDDAIDEGNETITIGVAHARFGAAAPAQVALTDNDTAAGLALSVSPARLAEGAGATNVTVTATLSGANNSGSEVMLPLNFSGSAAKGVDYTLSGTGSITISVGVSSGDTTLAITPTDDAIDEGLGEIVEIGTTHNNKHVAATLLLTDNDAGAPALSIEMAAGYVGADAILVRFVFPEPVTDFASDDVTVSGGNLGALSTQDGGRTYLSEVTPDAPIPDSITVTVKQDAVTDQSGNTGPAAPVAKTAQYDVTAPTLEIEGLPAAFHGTEPLVLVFRFSEPVEFGRSDVEVTNGRVTDFSGDGAVYKVEVTPDGGAVLRVGVKRGAVADGAGNTVAPISETAAPVDGELTLSKRIVRTPGRHLQSLPDQVLPDGMVVQGAEVHYQASLPQNSPLDSGSVEYSYSFVRGQGDVEFPAQDDDGNTATNRFRADWYGENIVEVTATDAAGKKAAVSDKVFVHFASRRILGGAAENLTQDQKDNIFRPDIHDRREASPGMAFVPGDIARADPASQKVAKGFHKVTEEKLLKTSRGTLLVASHISTIYPKLPRGDMVPGQGIALSRSGDFGNTWRNMLLVQQDDHLWGFPAFVEVGNAVYLYVLAGHPETVNYFPSQGWGGPYNTKYRGIYYFKSTDDGLTWSQPTRHDGLSTTVGIPWKESYSSADTFPKGAQPSTNILKVPNLQLDGKVSPLGYGLLLHAYGTGSMLASLDDGATWSKVANHNGHVNVAMHTEPAWTVLDNDDGDIYMIFRDDFGRFKQEYVMSREMRTGSSGLTFKAKHRQSLGNARGRAAHHWLTTIRSGEQRGRLLYSTPGAYTRHHVDLLVSRQAIQGQATIGSNLFGTARVKEGVGWGYSAVEYLEADLENTRGMGKDAVVLVGESEPIHKQTHQIIDLKPDRRGRDERFAATAYLVSWEYVEHLLREWEERTARALSFEPEEDWPTGTRGQYRAFSDFTDKHGHRWQGNAHVFRGIKDIWISNTAEHADRIEARNGFQVMALGYSTAQPSSVVLNPAGAGGVAAVSFYVKRFAHNLDAIRLVVEHNAGSGWQVALDRTYSGVAIPSSYTWVHVPINQPGDVQLRFRVEGTYGLLIDDITLTAAPGR